jgi:hypothetical protein
MQFHFNLGGTMFSLRPRSLVALILVASFILQFQAIPTVKAASAPSVASAPAWLDVQEKNGIAYFLYASPAHILRYDLSALTWLAEIPLANTPTAFTVDDSHLYVAFGVDISRVNLEGGSEAHLVSVANPVTVLGVMGAYLLAAHYSSSTMQYNLSSIRKADGQIADVYTSYGFPLFGISAAPGQNRLFGCHNFQSGNSFSISFAADGKLTFLGSNYESVYSSYPVCTRTWVSPDESMVFDNTGIAYTSNDMHWQGSLAGNLDDLTFAGGPIVLHYDTLIAFSTNLLETGRYTTANSPQHIVAFGGAVIAFRYGTPAPTTEIIPLTAFTSHFTPGPALDPQKINFVPDIVRLGNNGILYLLDNSQYSIFRWDIATRQYLATIPLADSPTFMTYSPSDNRLYLGYRTGEIRFIALNDSVLEQPFYNLPAPTQGLVIAGSSIFACDKANGYTHSTLNSTGVVQMRKFGHECGNEYWWNDAKRGIYFYSDSDWSDTSSMLYREDMDINGILGTLHQRNLSYEGHHAPLMLKNDGTVLVFASGGIFDGETFASLNTLPNAVSAGDWVNDTLFTLRGVDGHTQMQKWSASYTEASSLDLPGDPVRLIAVGEGLLAVTNVAGKTRFSIWDANLAAVYNPPLASFVTSIPKVSGHLLDVTFTNTTSQGVYTLSHWDFGDGASSDLAKPMHTYAQAGTYSASLSVSGPAGADWITLPVLVKGTLDTFVPVLRTWPSTIYTRPGVYTFENVCVTFTLDAQQPQYGTWTECVPKVEVDEIGQLKFYFSWEYNFGFEYACVNKHSDYNNPNMYIKDGTGHRYNFTDLGDAANEYISCMVPGTAYTGWFLFPPAANSSLSFIFHDDDQMTSVGPVTIPAK